VHEAGALGTGGTFFEEFGCFGHLRTTDSIGGDGDGAGAVLRGGDWAGGVRFGDAGNRDQGTGNRQGRCGRGSRSEWLHIPPSEQARR
jgi:hypothetical protein